MQKLMAQVCSVTRTNWKICDLKTKQVLNADINNTYINEEKPVVGDIVEYMQDEWGNCFIQNIQPRKNLISRKTKDNDKNIASNIDIVFIVSSFNNDFEIEKMERFTIIGSVPNAKIAFILTKSDLCNNFDEYLVPLQKRFPNHKIFSVNSNSAQDVEQLFQFWGENETAIFLGSSGVGKSSLINTLVGEKVAEIADVRESDDMGRHTTTARNIYYLPNGRIVIDTPGIRSIQGASQSRVQTAFEKIAELELQCKYKDCSHSNEDGCAVVPAIKSGEIDKEEFERFIRIQKSKDKQSRTNKSELHKESKLLKTLKQASKNKKRTAQKRI